LACKVGQNQLTCRLVYMALLDLLFQLKKYAQPKTSTMLRLSHTCWKVSSTCQPDELLLRSRPQQFDPCNHLCAQRQLAVNRCSYVGCTKALGKLCVHPKCQSSPEIQLLLVKLLYAFSPPMLCCLHTPPV
jgi:hypothetical protein